MSDKSSIEWTDATWNPVVGCTKVSPGCDHCYAERIVERFKGKGAFAKVTLNEERLAAPLKWRTPRRVFVNSMSDLFHDDVPDFFIAQVFATMAAAPQHTFQLLTKRHGRMRSLVGGSLYDLMVRAIADENGQLPTKLRWPLPNVWLGVSVEDQKWADIRIPALLETPAAVRFLSAEPLLGSIDIGPWLWHGEQPSGAIGWVIAGGESGPGARPMMPEWAVLLRDRCRDASVPFFFKQWGEWCHSEQMPEYTWSWLDSRINLGQEPHPEPHRVGKKRAGRLLDGRTWGQYPEAS